MTGFILALTAINTPLWFSYCFLKKYNKKYDNYGL